MGVPGFILWFLRKHKDIKFVFDNLDDEFDDISIALLLICDYSC